VKRVRDSRSPRVGPGTASILLALLAALEAPDAARAQVVTRGPYLQLATPTSIVVRWRTSVPTPSRVWCGTEPSLLWDAALEPASTTEHAVQLPGLEPGQRYWYAVGDSFNLLSGDATHTFVTPPSPGAVRPVRAWILGDSGEPGSTQLAVRDAFLAYTGSRGADLVLMLGDNAYSSGTDSQYQSGLFTPYAQWLRQWPLWPTRGNHDDVRNGDDNDYYDFFTLPSLAEAGGVPSGTEAYYSFDVANVHFVCLDSEGSSRSPGGPMLTWLRADLAATNQDWIVAYWHHPPYSKGSHDSDSEGDLREMRQNVVPILDSLGADLALAGHSHSYERSFLLRRHYGTSGTLADSMIVDSGDGRPDGDGPYEKDTPDQAPFLGAVYVVGGSSSKHSGGSLDHPVMVSSQDVAGSLVLDVLGDELQLRFLDSAGAVTDSFSIEKGGLVSVDRPRGPGPTASGLTMQARPLPARGSVELVYRLARPAPVRIAIHDGAGRRVATVVDREVPAGEQRARWNARDGAGRRVPAGVYFAVAESGAERRVARVIVTR